MFKTSLGFSVLYWYSMYFDRKRISALPNLVAFANVSKANSPRNVVLEIPRNYCNAVYSFSSLSTLNKKKKQYRQYSAWEVWNKVYRCAVQCITNFIHSSPTNCSDPESILGFGEVIEYMSHIGTWRPGFFSWSKRIFSI